MSQQELAGLLQSLHEISLELATLPDTDALCRRAVEWGRENLGFDRVGLWFIDAADPAWSLGTWGSDENGRLRDERHARVRRDSLVTPDEFYEGKIPVIFRQNEVCFDEQRHEVGRADKAMAPLWDGKTIIGELSVDNFVTRRPIQPADLSPLVLYARIIGHLHTLLRTREALARVSDERGTLLKELKHRTRNNLSIVAGLITLESARSETDEARCKLEALRDRVDALGALYSLLDREEPGLLRLDEYLASIAERLANVHAAETRGIRIEVDLQPVLIDARRASSLGIALNELLTDSLKHAFGGGRPGVLLVRLQAEGPMGRLVVSDDGPGLPPDLDPKGSGGLGLGLVSDVARQLGGEFSFRTESGAVFSLSFRL